MSGVNISFSLPLSVLKEGEYFIAFSPALDLSTCGLTYSEAKARFQEVVQIFFEEITAKGSLDQVLQNLGWERVRKEWVPPVVISHQVEQFKASVFGGSFGI